MKEFIITRLDEEEIRKIFPNIMKTAPGERGIFEKISPHISAAARWVSREFTGYGIKGGDVPGNVESLLLETAATEACRSVLHSLDVVLTPNGFATVGNNNMSPASKARVESLERELTDRRDSALEALLSPEGLPSVSGWADSRQAQKWRSCFATPFEIAAIIGAVHERYSSGMELLPMAKVLQYPLVEEYISPELFEAIARENQEGWKTDGTPDAEKKAAMRRKVFNDCRNMVLDAVWRSKNSGKREMISVRKAEAVVDVLRSNPEIFPEWQGSGTSLLFEDVRFRNKKDSPGYFF